MLKWLVALAAIWIVWKVLGRPKRTRAAALPVDRAEARAVLGVAAGADEATIRAAHRRLIGQVHPDRGGSADLTRRVNAARDLLLRDGG